MLTYGTASYIYGKRSNLKAKVIGMDTTKYFYDNFGNLNSVALPNGTIIDYVVDGQNRRIAKLLNGSIVKKWLYQDALNPVAELDSANNVTARYVYGNKANVPEYIVKSDTTYKVISDHLGNVRMLVNTSNGNITQRIDYDAWGNQDSNLRSNISSLSFAGGIYDEHTELVRFGARDYDAVTGRWASKDPIGFGGGVSNLYEYCVNDPVNYIDQSGLQHTLIYEWGGFKIYAPSKQQRNPNINYGGMANEIGQNIIQDRIFAALKVGKVAGGVFGFILSPSDLGPLPNSNNTCPPVENSSNGSSEIVQDNTNVHTSKNEIRIMTPSGYQYFRLNSNNQLVWLIGR